MKKLLVCSMLILGLIQVKSHAMINSYPESDEVTINSWIDLKDSVLKETKLTIFKNATPAYFYDFLDDLNDRKQKAGVVTEVLTYRFLSADAGWAHSVVTNRDVGTFILGGDIHVDRLVSRYFPYFTASVKTLLPESSDKFFNKLSIGFYGSHDFDAERFGLGFYTGLQFEF